MIYPQGSFGFAGYMTPGGWIETVGTDADPIRVTPSGVDPAPKQESSTTNWILLAVAIGIAALIIGGNK